MAEVLSVLTFKSARRVAEDHGTQSWVISQRRARRCAYFVCVRHQQGPYKAEGNEPHKHAFLVGKVSGVVPSSETTNRFRVEMSEYALIDGPLIPLNSASPTQYFPSLSSMNIDEASLRWRPVSDLPGEEVDVDTPSIGASNTEDDLEDAGDGEDVTAMSVLTQAKKMVADGLHVPLSAVEIIVRA